MNAHLQHPLLRIALGVALATAITWLGGLLFGPVSNARARELAQGMTSSAQRGIQARSDVSSFVGRQAHDAKADTSGLAS